MAVPCSLVDLHRTSKGHLTSRHAFTTRGKVTLALMGQNYQPVRPYSPYYNLLLAGNISIQWALN